MRRMVWMALGMLACDGVTETDPSRDDLQIEETIEVGEDEPAVVPGLDVVRLELTATLDEPAWVNLDTMTLGYGEDLDDADVLLRLNFARGGTNATLRVLGDTDWCQFDRGAASMAEAAAGRCGLQTTSECTTVPNWLVGFTSVVADSERSQTMRAQQELNSFEIVDADGDVYLMVVHIDGYEEPSDVYDPGAFTVEVELLWRQP